MASISTYLNFPGNTREAFEFYRSVFGGELTNVMTFGEMPPQDGMPPMPEAVLDMLMHIELTILGGHVLMGTDVPPQFGMELPVGRNLSINVSPDSREETERLFEALSEGAHVDQPLMDMFWGAYYGTFVDRFNIPWMFNFTAES